MCQLVFARSCVLSVVHLIQCCMSRVCTSHVCSASCSWCVCMPGTVCAVLCALCCVSSSVCPALYVAWCCLALCVRNCVPGVWTWPCGLRLCAQHRGPGSVFPEFWSCRVYTVCASGTYCSLVSSVLCSQMSGLVWGASQGLSDVCVYCLRSCA